MTEKIGDVENKIPNFSGLATADVFDTKIGEVENKITDASNTVVLITRVRNVENKIPDDSK